LAEQSARQPQVVEMRALGGLSVADTAVDSSDDDD
jgi:hypothetical protein